MSNALKDLGYYNAMAEDTGAARQIAAAVQATLEHGVGAAGPDTLLPQIVSVLAGRPTGA